MQEVPAEHTRRYGIVAGTPVNDHLVDVTRIVEAGAGSGPVAPGRGGPLHPDARRLPRNRQPAARRGRRIQLTDGIAGLLRRKVFAYRYEGKRYDCGSKEGFLQANVELALATRSWAQASGTFSSRWSSDQRRLRTWMYSSSRCVWSRSSWPV